MSTGEFSISLKWFTDKMKNMPINNLQCFISQKVLYWWCSVKWQLWCNVQGIRATSSMKSQHSLCFEGYYCFIALKLTGLNIVRGHCKHAITPCMVYVSSVLARDVWGYKNELQYLCCELIKDRRTFSTSPPKHRNRAAQNDAICRPVLFES